MTDDVPFLRTFEGLARFKEEVERLQAFLEEKSPNACFVLLVGINAEPGVTVISNCVEEEDLLSILRASVIKIDPHSN